LTRLSDLQKDNGPLLFSLLGQCFQDVGLTEWTSVVVKQCPDKLDCTKANFDDCNRDYLEAVAGFPNIGDQLICLLLMAKKPALMPMHEFMWRPVQLLSYLKSDYLPYPRRKKRVNKFSLHRLRRKFADLNKKLPANPLRMIAFFEQCQVTNKAAGVLEKINKDKKQPKEKSAAHVPTPRNSESSYKQHRCLKYRNYHQSDQHDCNNRQSDYRHQDNQCHDHG
jgi:hypothetical protein